MLDGFRALAAARRRRVRVAPRTCSRSRPRAKSAPATPGTCTSTGRRSSTGSAGGTSTGRAARPLPRPQAARARARASGSAGTRIHAAPGVTSPFYRASCLRSRAETSCCARPADRLRGARLAGHVQALSRDRGRSRCAPLPHALRRGLRHVAVRRGVAVGGDRRRYLPLLDCCAGAPLTLSPDPGAVRPARSAGMQERFRAFLPTSRAPIREMDAEVRAGGHASWRGASSAHAGRLHARRALLRGGRRRPAPRAPRPRRVEL